MARVLQFAPAEKAVIEEAVRKLRDKEQHRGADPRATAVLKSVVETLEHFCYQSVDFAKAILESQKTVFDCCREATKGCGSSVSDLEVYRRVVQCYFAGAQIDMQMTIILAEGCKESVEVKKPVVLNLLDF